MTDIPKIDIPQETLDEIQNNAAARGQRYLGHSVTQWMVTEFYSSDVRLYVLDQDRDPTTTAVQDEPVSASQIPETIVYNKEQYKIAAILNRVAAKSLAKNIKWFSVTPFNI